jgi:hypothetical protein
MTKTLAKLAAATAVSLVLASPAAAAQFFTFNFSTTTPLIGGPAAGSGVLTVDGPVFDSRGSTAQTITGITGTFNGSNIVGLATPFGANNLFYANGPTFVDGSGLGFVTAAGTNVNLFFQSAGSTFRVNTTNPFTSSFVSASATAVTAAVPEPSTWAMMLLGFAFIGGAVRSAKTRQTQTVSYG